MQIATLRQLFQIVNEKKQVKKVAIAAAEDLHIIKITLKMKELGLIAPIFVGNKQTIQKIALQNDLIINEQEIIDSKLLEESAKIAVSLVYEGTADLLMKGMLPTKVILRAVIHKEHGISNGNLLSHLALFESPYFTKIFGITDAAINIAPSLDEKMIILKNAIQAFQKMGIAKPRVAILAAIEKINPKMKATLDAHSIANLYSNRQDNCIVEGPLSLDIAVSEHAAQIKGYTSSVAGRADILLVPDIQSGNILYKCLTYLGGATTAGLVIGAKSPIILSSRADSEESKMNSIALAILLS
jgi:phosphate butyryltransferase